MPGSRRAPLSGGTLAAWACISFFVLFALWFEPLVTPRLEFIAQDFISLRKAAAEKAALTATDGSAALPGIAVVVVGERSLRQVGRWPWPRQRHADLLRALSRARLVVFDIVMPETSLPDDDRVFAESVREHGRVLMGFYVSRQDAGEEAGFVPATPVYPYPELFDAVADIGLVNAGPDLDGIVRESQLLWQTGELNLPSLALSSAQRLTTAKPGFIREPGGWLLRWENPGGASGATSPVYPPVHLDENASARFLPLVPGSLGAYEYLDVVSGAVPPETFDGAVVLVGVSGAGVSDLHRAVGGDFVPGVWFIAQSLHGLMTGRQMLPTPPFLSFAAAMLLCVACATAGLRYPLGRGAAITAGLVTAWAAAWAGIFWQTLYLLPVAAPAIAAGAMFRTAAGWRVSKLEKEWDVRTLPLEEVLLLPQRTVEGASFSDHLRSVWPKITALCALDLLEARAGTGSAELSACLAEVAARRETAAETGGRAVRDTHGLVYIPNYSRAKPRHRMLIPLPFDDGGSCTVVGWDRNRNMETLKSVAALVVSVATHYKSLEEQTRRQKMFLSAIQAISSAIDAKDPVTSGHSERVATLGKQIAKWLGWPPEAVDEVYFAGILHDVGKIGVPDNVLNKPGKLDDEEFGAMKTHPEKGAGIMMHVDIPKGVLRGIAEHHERLDGRGYPHGLGNTAISQVARILKIADVYDALVSKRQYKDPWPVAKACDLLYSQKGTEFDPHIADVFLQHMAPPGWMPPEAQ